MFKNILLSCCVCLALLLACETTLRLIDAIHSSAHPPLRIGEFDPMLGWKLNNTITPGSHVYRAEDGRSVDFYVNSDGYRGKAFGPVDPKTRRILVIGDSFAQADQIRLEERFSERLEAALNNGSEPASYSVRNLGVSGYSTDQEYLTYLEAGKKFDPDVTFLVFHDNDIWMNTEDIFIDVQKPRLELQNGQLVIAHRPEKGWVLPPNTYTAANPAARITGFRALKEYLASRSRLYAWIRKKVRENSFLVQWFAKLGLSGVGLEDLPDDFRVWSARPDQKTEAAWVLTEAILAQLQQQVSRDGGRLIVVYAPPRPAVYPEHWLATRIRYGFNDTDWDIRAVPKRLKTICRKIGVQMIDPTNDLVQKTRETKGKQRMYFAIDSHWTREAHAVVTDVILKEAADALR